VIDLAASQESGVKGILPLAAKPAVATLANDNGGLLVGFGSGTARGLVQRPGKYFYTLPTVPLRSFVNPYILYPDPPLIAI
jgi:hypothetical protein